jgi:hypothetical protein
LSSTSRRSPRSSRPMVMVATDDRLGRPGARLLHGAGRGRRPQGLRCAHRQAPAAALDPVVLAQQVAVMPCGAHRVRRRQGVSFLLCAPGDISILRRHTTVNGGLTLFSPAELAWSVDSGQTARHGRLDAAPLPPGGRPCDDRSPCRRRRHRDPGRRRREKLSLNEVERTRV